MTTTPTPPRGRRWLREGEILRKFDRYHWFNDHQQRWHLTTLKGDKVRCPYLYSRGISHRKKTRK